jgi:hypothetical protein
MKVRLQALSDHGMVVVVVVAAEVEASTSEVISTFHLAVVL